MEETKEKGLIDFYMQHHKKWIVVPLIVFVAAIFIIASEYRTTGDIMQKDISLKGGITATVYTEQSVDTDGLQAVLQERFGEANVRRLAEFGTNKQIGIIVEVTSVDEAVVKEVIQSVVEMQLTDENYSVELVGSSLGQEFYRQMMKALVFAFVLMAVAVFVLFRKIVICTNVVLAALFDIVITIAVVDLLGIKISAAGIAAFLMLIGYSIDTDMLLATRVMKRREGIISERVSGAIKTGLTMTATTVAALIVGLLIAESLVLKQVFTIILIGLLVDVVVTYMMNGPMIIMHQVKKETVK